MEHDLKIGDSTGQNIQVIWWRNSEDWDEKF